MKKLLLLVALLFSVCAFAQIEKIIPPAPNPPRLLNDLAGVLTPEQREALESKLVAYDDSTSNQVVVVTMNTVGDYEVQEVSLGILRKWGVGGKKNNNGIVILAAMQDRKVFISTGYGLEGAIPDVTAKAIVDNDIVPAFREGNYYRGFDAAINSVIKAAAGEYKAPEGYGSRAARGRGLSPGKIIVAIIVLFFILSMFGGGNRGGGYMSRRGYRGFGGPIFFPTGGGGWGGSSGGGGFGGGFGGFGGGSGGGGGADGSW